MFALSTLGMLLAGGGGRGAGQRQAAVDEDRRDYLRYLAAPRRRVRAVAAEQRAALEHVHPDPAAWPAVLAAGRLWERRGADPDFGQLRVGRGAQRLATRLVAPQTGPVEGIEPITALALRRFLRGHAVVPDLPVALSLRGSSARLARAGAGRRTRARAGAGPGAGRAVRAVAQPGRRAARRGRAAVPGAGVGVGQVAAARRPPAPPRRRRAAADGHRRRRRRAALVGRRARRAAAGRGAGEPHLLVVVDEAAGPGPWAGVAGATVLRVGAPPGRRPGPAVVRLLVGSVGPGRDGRPRRAVAPIGRPDALAVAEATALARRLARYRPAGAGAGGRCRPRGPAGLPALLGLGRRARAGRDRRAGVARCGRAPATPTGCGCRSASTRPARPVALDLKESAQGGSGPHGLCVGATGSGKSELLRTLVLGLAATHSSAELNLVLVDFKGGATFLGLGRAAARLRGDHQPGRRAARWSTGWPTRWPGRSPAARSCCGRRAT